MKDLVHATNTGNAKQPEDLEAEGHADLARGHAKLAEAARLRRARAPVAPAEDWIPIAKLPLAKKSARAIVRSKAVESKEVRGRLYVLRSSFDSFMRTSETTSKPASDDDALRAELGLQSGGRR